MGPVVAGALLIFSLRVHKTWLSAFFFFLYHSEGALDRVAADEFATCGRNRTGFAFLLGRGFSLDKPTAFGYNAMTDTLLARRQSVNIQV